MEFFSEVPVRPDPDTIRQQLVIDKLPALCDSIDTVLADQGDSGRIYCLWGEFDIRREEIRNGVRFSLSSCPNALAWTITRDDDEQDLTLHCTINTHAPDGDFIESIELFLDDWARGLQQIFGNA